MNKNNSQKPKSEDRKRVEAEMDSYMDMLRYNAHAAVCIDGETKVLPSIAEIEEARKATGKPTQKQAPNATPEEEEEDFPIMEVNVRRIGKLVRISKANTAALIGQLPEKFKAYPANSTAFRLGEFRIMFPMPKAPIGLGACSWGLVTDASTGKPLALVPSVWAGDMEKLRTYFRVFAPVPIIVMHNGTLYWDEPKYSYDVGCGWIPLTPDEN